MINKQRRLKLMRRYEAAWNKRRENIRDKILRRGNPTLGANLEPGQYARVYRPSLNKLAIKWSEPRKIIDKPSAATRTIQYPDGTTKLEHIINLQPTEGPPIPAPSGSSPPPTVPYTEETLEEI